jgi:hypothetical protein
VANLDARQQTGERRSLDCRTDRDNYFVVYFHPKVRPQLDVVPGPYLITRRLPATQDGEFQYEIRNTLEEYNRVARESELTRA